MKNKIMKSMLIFIFVFSISAFSMDVTEVAVTLPNGISALDEFDGNNFNKSRWSANSWSKWDVNSGNAIVKVKNNNDNDYAFLYQPFDYNSGSLKSDYYHFQTTIKANYSNSLRKGGLMISETDDFESNDFAIASKLNISLYNNWLWSYSINDRKLFDVGIDYNTIYIFDMYLERVGNTNEFNITVTATGNDGEILKHNYTKILNNIYVCLWSDKGERAKFRSFLAYTTGKQKDAVSISGLIQNGDEMSISWNVDPSSYKNVQVVYSEDSNITFGLPDLNVYVGTSNNKSTTYPIASFMKDKKMYFGIKGYDTNIESDTVVIQYDYLKPVNAFTYSNTANKNEYTFNWDSVAGATGYQITNGSVIIPISSNINTATMSNITNPTTVTIIATKNATIGAGISKSTKVTAVPSSLGDVKNLRFSYNANTVSFQWDLFPGAESYILLKRISDSSYIPVTSDILSTSTTIDYNNFEVVSQYVVKAVVDNVKSQPSNVVAVKSKVKGLVANYEVSNDRIALNWQGINDADNYKIYVSDSNNMSNAEVFSSSLINYNYGVSLNYNGIKYFQVEAVNGNGVSFKSDVVSADLSAVENLLVNYVPNSGVVNLTWNEYSGANSYKVFISNYENMSNSIESPLLNSNSYNYTVKGVDLDEIYFQVQASTGSKESKKSEKISSETFSKDKVLALGALPNINKSTIALTWNSLPRATSYEVYVSNFDDMASEIKFTTSENKLDYGILPTDGKDLYFQVRGVYKTFFSERSDVRTSLASENVVININGSQTSIEDKKYNSPIEFDMTYKIKETKLYNVLLSIDLNNILLNGADIVTAGNSEIFMNYIYPEIVDFKLLSEYPEKEDGSSEIAIDYLAQIQSKGKNGYKINIIITDPLISEKLTLNRILKISVKTDLQFNKGVESYILSNGVENYSWMELPFYIEDQLIKANGELTQSNVLGGLKINANIFFDVTDTGNPIGSNSVPISIPINFINRNLAPGE